MTPAQVAVILGLAALRDRRTVGDLEVQAWHQDIGDLDFDDAKEAVSRHYRLTTDWLMPAHIRTHVAELSRERRRNERLAARELAAQQSLAGQTTDRRPEIAAFAAELSAPLALALPSRYEPDDERDRRVAEGVAAARKQLPDESPTERTQRLAVARARRERGRPERPNPVPKRRRPPKDWPEPCTDEIAALATRYLLDGYPPADVADRLAVSRTWCQRTLRRLRPNRPEETPHVDPPAA